MRDKNFRDRYKNDFDGICASDELKSAITNLTPRKPRKVLTPFKATIGTVAAAVMIFVAVQDYNFEKDTSGVINQKVVSTPLPKAEFVIVEKKTESKSTQPPKKEEVAQQPKQTAVVPAVVPTETEGTESVQLPKDDNSVLAEDIGVMTLSEDDQVGRMAGANEYVYPTVENWSLNQYYEYLGVNVSQKILGQYTGSDSFEFELGSDGLPLDDTAVLNFATNNGATLRVTVSKHVLFDSAMSGTVSEAGNGYNAYKISGGVYYNIYALNTTKDAVQKIINTI